MVFSTREYSLNILEFIRVKFSLITQKLWIFWMAFLVIGQGVEFINDPYVIGMGWLLVAYSIISPISSMIGCYFDAKSSLNTSCFQPHRVTVDDEGLFIQICEGNSYFVRWASIGKIQKIASTFVLFLTKDIYLIVPFRAFETRLDKMDFEYLLNKQKFGMRSVAVSKQSTQKSE